MKKITSFPLSQLPKCWDIRCVSLLHQSPGEALRRNNKGGMDDEQFVFQHPSLVWVKTAFPTVSKKDSSS